MILENELLQLALGMAQAVLLLLCAPLVTGIVKKAVSYTHLDVYKRQGL